MHVSVCVSVLGAPRIEDRCVQNHREIVHRLRQVRRLPPGRCHPRLGERLGGPGQRRPSGAPQRPGLAARAHKRRA